MYIYMNNNLPSCGFLTTHTSLFLQLLLLLPWNTTNWLEISTLKQ